MEIYQHNEVFDQLFKAPFTAYGLTYTDGAVTAALAEEVTPVADVAEEVTLDLVTPH